MTEDIRADGRYLGFCMQPKNGESNYHYYHMNYKHKPIGKNFSDTYRKIIDGNLMINDTPLNRILRQCTKKLRSKIGQETAFKKKWKRDHSNLVEWNEDLTYQGNINAAAALATYVPAAAAADTAAAATADTVVTATEDDPNPLPPGDALEEAQLGALAAAAAATVDTVVTAAEADPKPLPPGDALEEAQLGALAAAAADDEGVVAAAPAPPSIAAADDDDDNEPTITDGMASVSDVKCLLLTITQQLDRQKIYEMFKLATDQQNDQQNLQELITLSKDLLCS